MINTSLGYLASLMLIASGLVYIAHKSHHRLFHYVPAIVMLYFIVVILTGFGLWDSASTTLKETRSGITSAILPAMLFLMLLQCDMRVVIKLGKKLLLTFFGASITIIIGFIITYSIMHRFLPGDAWRGLSSLSASWMGGTGNMIAVQNALHVPSDQVGYILLTDSISYSIWFALLFALIAKSRAFDRWSRASSIEDHINKLDINHNQAGVLGFPGMFFLFAIALSISSLSGHLAAFMPVFQFMSTSTWTILIATFLGVIGGMTPLAKIGGCNVLSSILLYTLVALIASSSSFKGLALAPLYILCGIMILIIHALLMSLIAKIFRLNLSICSIASLANIGGIAGATILAGAYNKNLVAVAVVMALLGFIIGTQGGLFVARILSLL